MQFKNQEKLHRHDFQKNQQQRFIKMIITCLDLEGVLVPEI